jgi:ATP-dependent exoDNAse (exonuclease V) beta subunit
MVLCPTRAIAKGFAKSLQEKSEIPVRRIASKSIPQDLWKMLLVLRLAADDDDLALRQWLEVLEVPRDDIISMRDLALAERRTLFDVVRRSTKDTIKRFVHELEDLRAAHDDMDELLKKAKFLAGVPELPWETEATSVSALILKLYEEHGLLDTEEGDTETDEVLVTTLHSSKGLEAQVVFIVQLSSRYIPNPTRDSDEELRVLYVGMTRPKKELYLSSSYVYDPRTQRKYPSPSPFLTSIAEHLHMQKIMRAKPKKQRRK